MEKKLNFIVRIWNKIKAFFIELHRADDND